MHDLRLRPDLRFRPDLRLHFDARWLFRCRVGILIVVDGSIGFGSGGFSLGEVLTTLQTDPWSHVEFEITKAHRQSAAGDDVTDNFRFDSHDLGQYSQIWLFGIHSTTDALSNSELRALSEYMDGGGGVLAMGDHQNLGLAMCGKIPRVRSMRRWHFPSPGPDGEPVAPDQTGVNRHDTVMPNPAGGAGSQSDAIPQPIQQRWYSRKVGSGLLYQVQKYPHPVLCGPDGVINYLPDHMHEGLCEAPTDLSKNYTFDGYTTAEYPSLGSHQERPEVIAWATDRNSGGAQFGVIGAYDGHRSGVGRVLVDATWHHWFNINLTGLVAASDPADPSYDPVVVPKWESIQAYFRNVGTWLARPTQQACLRNGGWLLSLNAFDIVATLQPLGSVDNHLAYYWQLGVNAKDALGRVASQCQTTRWVLELLPELPWPLDPWLNPGPRPVPDPPPWLDQDVLEAVALGGAIHSLAEKYSTARDPLKLAETHGKEIEAVAQRGAAQAMGALSKHFERCGAEAGVLLSQGK